MGCAIEKLAAKLTPEKLAWADTIELSASVELELGLIMLAGPTNDPTAGSRPCTLAKDPGHPGDNWVTQQHGLPTYICNMAKAIKKDGHSTSEAIAIAVSQIKKLIATTKNPQVKEEATKAIAEWEAKKGAADAHETVKSAHKAAA